MKKHFRIALPTLLLLPILFSGFLSAAGGSPDTIPEEVTTDLYYADSVLLRNLEYPEDLSADEGSSIAGVTGPGTVVIGDSKNGGFPRIVLPGDTDVTSFRSFGGASIPEWWDGELAAPQRMPTPNTENIGFEEAGAHRDTRLKVVGSYQLGLSNEWFDFSNDSYLIVDLGIQDGLKVWVAKDSDDTDEDFIIAEDDFCITENGLCAFKMTSGINQLAFLTTSFFDCPVERVENGGYGPLPDCRVVCDPGYILDFAGLQCVRTLEEEDTGGFVLLPEFSQRVNSSIRARQGYFRYLDSRGSQLEKDNPEGLSFDERRFVELRNTVNGARNNAADEEIGQTVTERNLWEAIKDLRFDLWREAAQQKASRPDTHAEEATNQGEISENPSQSHGQSFGGLLPSTGPGIFVGLAIAGISLMAFGSRKR